MLRSRASTSVLSMFDNTKERKVARGNHPRQANVLAGRGGAPGAVVQPSAHTAGHRHGRRPLRAIRGAQAARLFIYIGIDACREILREASRKGPPNALYVIANALALPPELHGLATRITINFTWGSLLAGLIGGDPGLLAGLRAVARPGATLDGRLNAGALAEAGCEHDAGGAAVRQSLRDHGFGTGPPVMLNAQALRACPSTWAKHLAFGRDPHALLLTATYGVTVYSRPGSKDQPAYRADICYASLRGYS